MLIYQKENLKGKSCCMHCTTTVTQCASMHSSEQGFSNRGGGGRIPLGAGGWKILLGGFDLYDSGNLSSSEFDPSNLFSMPKTTFCKYWTLIKIKIGLTCVQQVWSENRNGTGAMTIAKNEVFSRL